VPVHDGTALLRTCVQALLAQDYPGDLVEVLVVDNASTEDVAAALPPDPRVRLLHEPVPGSYRARNAALPHVRGEVVAFTDADCRPHPDWITRGVAALRSQPDVAMVGGRVDLVFREGHPVTAWEVYEAAHAFPQRDYLAKQHFAVTANVLTWRTTLDDVGGFDARLASRGDAEWGQRVARSGGKQVYADDAVVDHPARAARPCGWPGAVATSTSPVPAAVATSSVSPRPTSGSGWWAWPVRPRRRSSARPRRRRSATSRRTPPHVSCSSG
jgi:GT2 family glycosyltransferase